MSKDAWGRWGADDEIGALNLIGGAQRLAAAALVTDGRVVSLAQPLDGSTPIPSHRLGYGHFMDRDGGDYAAGARRPGGFAFAEDTVVMPTHLGTHIDALCHVWYDEQLYNGHSSDGVRSAGADKCGVGTMPPIVTRGVLLDVVGERPEGLAKGEAVTAEMLQALCARRDIALGPGDVVLVRTGWFERADELGHGFYDGEPGLDISAAVWLAEQDVAAIGADNYAVEAIPFPEGTVFPVHQCLLRDHGVPLLEGLVLSELASTGRTDFLFSCAALPLSGATGSPVHPYALL
jgi:kynurenine formamidase